MKIERPLSKLREGEYPKAGDQLDALWKIIGALPAETLAALPADAVAVMHAVQGVKTRLPKKQPKAK